MNFLNKNSIARFSEFPLGYSYMYVNVYNVFKWLSLIVCSSRRYIHGSCNLCNLEKINIIYSKDNNLLNKRSEINCKCRHRDKFLLNNYLEEDGTWYCSIQDSFFKNSCNSNYVMKKNPLIFCTKSLKLIFYC